MLLFALSLIGVAFALTKPKPQQSEDLELEAKRLAWVEADFQCKNWILNALSLQLYNVYNSFESAYMIWDALSKKYTLEDAGSSKYMVTNFLNFVMSDGEDISSQIDKFQVLVGKLAKENIILPYAFVTGSLIEKLPSSWNPFKLTMKHKRKEWTFERVVVWIKIEERNRAKDKAIETPKLKANLVETEKQGNSKKGLHVKKDNSFNKKKEVNMVEKPTDWVLDIGATRHISGDQSSFSKYSVIKLMTRSSWKILNLQVWLENVK
ncbi:uncharacterized protein LOC122070232 [Macadamia integrifolia]|uniref:uncharacterized protein LOC122070232 n=1 Tax=Macadamia integrifolia TaxID=60698 RepID=UPI001C4FFDBA|nr:uncharacterized protein LOC122070232 [Macadamia integrifolia]